MNKTSQNRNDTDHTTENNKIESGRAENNRTERNRAENKRHVGTICEIQRNSYHILFEDKTISAKLKGTFNRENEALPVVGDHVIFLLNENGDSLITSICERKSVLKRPYAADHSMDYGKEQIMVANVDDVFIVSSLNDNYNFNRIARYVSVTLQGNATPVVILTKADLCSNPGRYVREIEALSDKVRVHMCECLVRHRDRGTPSIFAAGKNNCDTWCIRVEINFSECAGTGRRNEDLRNPGVRF